MSLAAQKSRLTAITKELAVQWEQTKEHWSRSRIEIRNPNDEIRRKPASARRRSAELHSAVSPSCTRPGVGMFRTLRRVSSHPILRRPAE